MRARDNGRGMDVASGIVGATSCRGSSPPAVDRRGWAFVEDDADLTTAYEMLPTPSHYALMGLFCGLAKDD